MRRTGGPKKTTVTIELSGIDTVVPKGSRLRLSVRNHFLIRPATREAFAFMPYLSSYRVDLEHGPGRMSKLLLPVRAWIAEDLTTRATSLSLSNPVPIPFSIRSSPASAGTPYLVLVGLSGQGPAVTLPGNGFLFLRLDPATQLFLQVLGTPLVAKFSGALDAAGAATPVLDLTPVAPLPPAMAGLSMDLAALAFRGPTVRATAPVRLTLVK